MNKLKFLLVMAIAIFSISAADAQTSKKKNKIKKHQTAMHYQCPMNCEGEKTYLKNGKCPVCGMQMKPVKASVAHALYQCPTKCEGEKTYGNAGKCPVCGMALAKVEKENAAATYLCPMKCEEDKTYEKPGKCPVCKMDFTKTETKKASGHEGHNHD